MSKISIFILLFVALPLSTSFGNDKRELPSNSSLKYHYDLRSRCGFSLNSDRALVQDGEKCSFLYQDKVNSPFFYGSISSSKDYLSENSTIGAIQLSGGTPRSTRTSYYDAQRDVTLRQIRSQRIKLSTGNGKNIVIVSELEVTYDKPDKTGQVLIPAKETYECWDGVFYGKTTAVSLALCSISSAKKSSFASQTSWQADVIKSLFIE